MLEFLEVYLLLLVLRLLVELGTCIKFLKRLLPSIISEFFSLRLPICIDLLVMINVDATVA